MTNYFWFGFLGGVIITSLVRNGLFWYKEKQTVRCLRSFAIAALFVFMLTLGWLADFGVK